MDVSRHGADMAGGLNHFASGCCAFCGAVSSHVLGSDPSGVTVELVFANVMSGNEMNLSRSICEA